jgi:hypothetical protein
MITVRKRLCAFSHVPEADQKERGKGVDHPVDLASLPRRILISVRPRTRRRGQQPARKGTSNWSSPMASDSALAGASMPPLFAWCWMRFAHDPPAGEPEEVEKGLVAAGIPQFAARSVRELDEETSRGYHAIATPTVMNLTGRIPTSVENFLQTTVPALMA